MSRYFRLLNLLKPRNVSVRISFPLNVSSSRGPLNISNWSNFSIVMLQNFSDKRLRFVTLFMRGNQSGLKFHIWVISSSSSFLKCLRDVNSFGIASSLLRQKVKLIDTNSFGSRYSRTYCKSWVLSADKCSSRVNWAKSRCERFSIHERVRLSRCRKCLEKNSEWASLRSQFTNERCFSRVVVVSDWKASNNESLIVKLDSWSFWTWTNALKLTTFE